MKDILEILETYSIDVKREGSVIRAFCPFHHDTKKPNFTVYTSADGGSWFCFACAEGGDSAFFVSKMEKISYKEAKKRLGEGEENPLSEVVDGLHLDYEPLTLNMETSLFLGTKVREVLYAHPQHKDAVFDFLKTLDSNLSEVITPQKQALLYKKFAELKKNIV